MFCIKCGCQAEKGNFCTKCFLETHELFNIKDFGMLYCGICGINMYEIKDKAKSSVKSKNVINSTDVSLKQLGNRFYATVTCTGKIDGVAKKETKKSLVMLRRQMCDMHVKLSGGYYEAMIQVRGPNKEVVLKKVKQLLPEKSIVTIEAIKEGYDIKIMRKSNAASAAKTLRDRFSVKDSYKVGGSKKGKMVYRNYYAVR